MLKLIERWLVSITITTHTDIKFTLILAFQQKFRYEMLYVLIQYDFNSAESSAFETKSK